MNTQEELDQAYKEIREGTLLKVKQLKGYNSPLIAFK